MTSIKISVGFELKQHPRPSPSIFDYVLISWSDCFLCPHIIQWNRWRHHSFIILCVKSRNFDPQEYVHSKSSWKVGGWAGHIGNFHISNGRMPFYWPVPGLCRYKVKIRTTAHVTSSSKIPTDLIGVNNYPGIKTQIHSTRVCLWFLNRHIATHIASPSNKLFLLGVAGALPPTRLRWIKNPTIRK